MGRFPAPWSKIHGAFIMAAIKCAGEHLLYSVMYEHDIMLS